MVAILLILIAASLYYWLWVFYRGGWATVAQFLHRQLIFAIWIVLHVVDFAAMLLALLGVLRLDLSAIAVASVLFAGTHLVPGLYGRVAALKPFRAVGERIEKTLKENA